VYLVTANVAASAGFATAIRVNDVTDTNFTPLTTGRYEDWMYYDTGHLRIGSSANAIAPSVPERVIVVDVKSRRKIDEIGQSLRFQFEAASTNSQSLELNASFSTLIALP
jgi:hypothetical protein